MTDWRPPSLRDCHKVHLGHVKSSWRFSNQSINTLKWGHRGIWLYLFLSLSRSLLSQGNGIFRKNFPHGSHSMICVFHRSSLSPGIRAREMDSFLLSDVLVLGFLSGLGEWPHCRWHPSLGHLLRFTHLIMRLFSSSQISFHWFHFSLASRCSGTSTWLGIRTSCSLG